MNVDLAMAGLVDQFYDPLYRFAFRLTGREADACDLVQETFYIWARKGSQLRTDSKVKSWLFTTLYREFLQRRRHAVRFPEVELAVEENELPSIAPEPLARIDGQTATALLGELDEVFRAPLALFYLEDYAYDEIGQILGIPLGTVKSRLSRGVAQLRERLTSDVLSRERKHE